MCYEFTLNSREVVSSIQVNKYFNKETRACVLQITLTLVLTSGSDPNSV